MTATVAQPHHRVLVVSSDGRVSQALAASINVTPGMLAYAADGHACDVYEAVTVRAPDVAVVDVPDADPSRAIRLVRRLARRLPVIAVSDSSRLGARALAAGASLLCEKNGDPDSLAAAVAAVASTSPRPAEGGTR
jgi:DNA-binding NarL/FixJ family response regulator